MTPLALILLWAYTVGALVTAWQIFPMLFDWLGWPDPELEDFVMAVFAAGFFGATWPLTVLWLAADAAFDRWGPGGSR